MVVEMGFQGLELLDKRAESVYLLFLIRQCHWWTLFLVQHVILPLSQGHVRPTCRVTSSIPHQKRAKNLYMEAVKGMITALPPLMTVRKNAKVGISVFIFLKPCEYSFMPFHWTNSMEQWSLLFTALVILLLSAVLVSANASNSSLF